MSSVLEGKGKLTETEEKNYAQQALTYLAKAELTDMEKKWVADYIKTNTAIQESKKNINLAELSRDLLNLPKTTITTIKTNELVIQPQVFNGEWPKPRKWMTDYNEAIIANGWSDRIAIKYLPTYLSKSAKDWYFTEVKPRIKEDTKWAAVHGWFAEIYLGESDYEELAMVIENSKQWKDEKAANFIPRMRRLIQLLEPDISETELIRKLKAKLRPEYKQLICFKAPATVSELRDWCAKIEAGFPKPPSGMARPVMPRPNQQSGRGRPVVSFNSWDNSRSSGARRPIQNWRPKPPRDSRPMNGYTSGTRGMSNELICYNCNEPGHISRNCPRPRRVREPYQRPTINALREGGRPEPYLSNDNSNSKEPARNEDEESCSDENVVTEEEGYGYEHQINVVHVMSLTSDFVRHPVSYNDITIESVIDSGAKISVLNKELVTQNGWKADGPVLSLCGPNGQSLGARKTINLMVQIKINNEVKRKLHNFGIIDELKEPVLLGRDLLKSFGIIVNHHTSTLAFHDLIDKHGVHSIPGSIIPARAQTVITGLTRSQGTVLVAPFLLANGLMLANSIGTIEDGTLPLLVTNPGTKPVKLDQMQLACLEQLDRTNESPAIQINQVIEIPPLTEIIQVGDPN